LEPHIEAQREEDGRCILRVTAGMLSGAKRIPRIIARKEKGKKTISGLPHFGGQGSRLEQSMSRGLQGETERER